MLRFIILALHAQRLSEAVQRIAYKARIGVLGEHAAVGQLCFAKCAFVVLAVRDRVFGLRYKRALRPVRNQFGEFRDGDIVVLALEIHPAQAELRFVRILGVAEAREHAAQRGNGAGR